jgi:hypothetical protein
LVVQFSFWFSVRENIFVFPFCIAVDTNNGLYGGAKPFVAEVNSLAGGLLNDILSNLKVLGDHRQGKAQSKLSLDLFWEILNWGEVTQMGNLALNLWNLSRKHLDSGTALRSHQSVRRRGDYNEAFLSLVSKMIVD